MQKGFNTFFGIAANDKWKWAANEETMPISAERAETLIDLFWKFSAIYYEHTNEKQISREFYRLHSIFCGESIKNSGFRL